MSAARVAEAGPGSGPGWTGTSYTFTVTKHYVFHMHPTTSNSVITNRLTETITGTVGVDKQGRVRRLDIVDTAWWLLPHTTGPEKAVTNIDMAFGDFGVSVSVTPPPASQTTSG